MRYDFGMPKSLTEIAAEKPYPEFQDWWPMGEDFLRLMQAAILETWRETVTNHSDHTTPLELTADYISSVYGRDLLPDLVDRFVHLDFSRPFYSGEFDALSYAYFRTAFEALRMQNRPDGLRRFTQIVGRRFFTALADRLALDIPPGLQSGQDLLKFKEAVAFVGEFLVTQGYLRDAFSFSFEVDLPYHGRQLKQAEADFIERLNSGKTAFAVYRMGYPAILPSAVYLFHTMGEAQHHSSRTIEELFARSHCEARETDDFDPTGFPAEEVVELWEIHKR